MGDSNLHTLNIGVIFYGLKAHLANQMVAQPPFQVFSNLNVYYSAKDPSAYISPDVMVVKPYKRLPESLASYRLGVEGPAPVLTVEVLSERSAQQRDLNEKMDVYRGLGVAEYLLADTTGRYLAERLLAKQLQKKRVWKDSRNSDGSISSRLGFSLLIDDDGDLRLIDSVSKRRYSRPAESDARIRELEAELARLREQQSGGKPG